MSFLSKSKKADLYTLAMELGLGVTDNMRVPDLCKLIAKDADYNEEFAKNQLTVITEDRKLQERREIEKEKEKEERDFQLQKIKLENERELQLEKIRLENERLKLTPSVSEGKVSFHELTKIVPKFDIKEGDIVLFMTLFERQAKRLNIEKSKWVSAILAVMPPEITQLIARETEEKFDDYDYIKNVLLKRFKMSPEHFRNKFVTHQRNQTKSWRDFVFEITVYFEEWLEGTSVNDFEGLKQLMITDQLKRRVPGEVRNHFIDQWTKFIVPGELADRLDEYEQVRANPKKPNVADGKSTQASSFRSRFEYKSDNSKFRDAEDSSKKTKTLYSPRVERSQTFKPTCFACGATGHLAKFCTRNSKKEPLSKAKSNLVKTTEPEQNKTDGMFTAKVSIPVSTPSEINGMVDDLKIVNIRCGTKNLRAIVDTGAQISVLREDAIDPAHGEGEGTIQIISAFGESEIAALKLFNLKIDDDMHSSVPITCAVSKKLVNDMLISATAYELLLESIQLYNSTREIHEPVNSNEEKGSYDESHEGIEGHSRIEVSLVTRNSAYEKTSPVDAQVNDGNVQSNANSRSGRTQEFIQLQQEDANLKEAWELARRKRNSYDITDGFLTHSEWICGELVTQIVLPECKRKDILRAAHDISLAGHLGEKKTKQRIKYSFYWPTIKTDVKAYCESCKECQVRRVTTYRDRIPIQPVVRPETPFEVWSVDCIGPLEPKSRKGHSFIICAVDLCTRWAEAIPVKNIKAKTTCEALMKIFTQTGFPKTICTDQGPNFTAELTEAFRNLLGISPRFATPGHPESMGAVERWNRTLKDMLNKNIQENGSNWEEHLPYLLFAYREVPHSTTGVSPYQLVYGRLPSGPLKLIKQIWTGEKEIPTNVSKPIEQYLADLTTKLDQAHALAKENSEKAQADYVNRYNLRAREKRLEVGDQVLVLIPSSSHKLLKTWMGPATIVELPRQYTAKVKMENGSVREVHFNKLRPYVARIGQVGLIFDQDMEFGDLHYAPTDVVNWNEEDVQNQVLHNTINLKNTEKLQLADMLRQFADVFSTTPGLAKVGSHSVKLTADYVPKRIKPYRIPIALQEEVERQTHELLQLGLIEPSESEWAHPIVCVSKKNGKIRLCVDYRLLNSFTITDAYPMQNARDLLFEVGKANFISVLDLTKGYWQIPVEESSKPLTAFVTHNGHFQFRVMPFGMKNAGGTFQKCMDKILSRHRKYCRSYIDDVAIFSESWEEHLRHIKSVFLTLREAGLTVNLEKCDFGKRQVKYLGHIIGSGQHSPDPEKVASIRNMSRPTTKKELRSFLGLVNYYREYVQNFSMLVLPLTNMTKKKVPTLIPWNSEAEAAFQALKEELIKLPSLHTPDISQPFILHTDASLDAIGICLSQVDVNGKEKPIAFFSKKLTDAQRKWSTIEREAYAVIEALKKFDTWIFGAIIEVVSDHNPLTYLTQSAPNSAKLTRWALALQRYNAKISYRKGAKHHNADALSRLPLQA